MKKLVSICFILLLTACQSNIKQPLPKLIVKANDKKIEVYQGSYCWSNKCVDMISPNEIVAKHTAVVVPKSSKIVFEFDHKPSKDSVIANVWTNGSPKEQSIVNSNTIIVPQEAGTYVYDVSARWNEGSSSYVFQVKVE